MAFMETQVMKFDAWRCETTVGTEVVPCEIAGADDLHDYLEGAQREPAELVSGWFYRLSAPGYLDCTAWSGPCETAEEAEKALIEMYPDDEDDEEDEET